MSVTVKETLSVTASGTAKYGQNGYSGRDSIGAFAAPSPNEGNAPLLTVFSIAYMATQTFWSKVQPAAPVGWGEQAGATYAQVVSFCLNGGNIGVGGV